MTSCSQKPGGLGGISNYMRQTPLGSIETGPLGAGVPVNHHSKVMEKVAHSANRPTPPGSSNKHIYIYIYIY